MRAKIGTKQSNPKKDTIILGLTGGIGAGKSLILDYIRANYRARVLSTDEIAKEVCEPGGMCYTRLRQLLPEEAFGRRGKMDRDKVAELIYENPELRNQMNELIHPAVGLYLQAETASEQKKGLLDFVIIESALYDGSGFALLCKEVWNVSAPQDVRKARLMESRGYSQEKVDSIFESQEKYDKIRRALKVQIYNGEEADKAYAQVDEQLTRLKPGCKRG